MDYLSYKTFVWPQNPHTYVEKTSREPQYVTVDGVVYFDDMGELKRTITGSGTFYGANAYTPEVNRKALDLILSGQLDAKRFVTNRFELKDLDKGFESLASGKSLKNVIVY